MREISILKVLFTTLVSMPESVCGWILLEYRLPEWKWPTAMAMVLETLKISWNISLPPTVPHDWDGVWIWEITTRCGLPTTLWGSSEAMTETFFKTLSSLVGFVMTMIGVCWAGIIKLIGGRSVFHTCCQEIKTCHIKQKRGLWTRLIYTKWVTCRLTLYKQAS